MKLILGLCLISSFSAMALEYPKPPKDYVFQGERAKPWQPTTPRSRYNVVCEKAPSAIKHSMADLEASLKSKNVFLVNKDRMQVIDVQNFAYEFNKIPKVLRDEMSQRMRTHLIHGNSVMDDPSWKTPALATWDGRNWSQVHGVGGFAYLEASHSQHNEATKKYNREMREYCKKYPKQMPHCSKEKLATYVDSNSQQPIFPTRIVVNRLYDNRASNLTLHEHGHAIDYLYSVQGVTRSQAWAVVRKSPRYDEFVKQLCPNNYCFKSAEEGFAELFSYYHACDKSRQDLELQLPEAADFFRSFRSIKDTK